MWRAERDRGFDGWWDNFGKKANKARKPFTRDQAQSLFNIAFSLGADWQKRAFMKRIESILDPYEEEHE